MGYRKQPFGYQMDNGETVIHPEEADIVKNIFRNYLAGMSFATIAEKLNGQNIQYYPCKPWNKNMLARLLEDDRYIGSGVYPAIIGKETLTAAAALRGEKTTPYETTAVQKALRRLCGHKPSKSSEDQILQIMNHLIKDPTLISCPMMEKREASEAAALQDKLDELLEQQPVDEYAAKSLILSLAAIRYDEISNDEYETERLRNIFATMKPISELDTGLLAETLSSVSVQRGGKIKITLKNGQVVEGGNLT